MRLVNKKRHIIRNLIRVLIIAFFVIVALDNIIIHTTVTEVSINDLPGSFDGYRIVQVSDLHNNVYGIGQSYLISCIRGVEPDIIVITGDLIDRNTKNVDNAMMFVSKAVEIAPVFYVSGNHEANLPEEYAELVRRMDEAGVSILDNENVSVLLQMRRQRFHGPICAVIRRCHDDGFFAVQSSRAGIEAIHNGLELR